MEITTKINAFEFSGAKIMHVIALSIGVCIISRGPLMGESLICGISLIAYMLSKNTLNIYYVIPAAAGLLPYISRGYDPWGYMAAICLCGLVFAVCRRVHMELWQRAAIAASMEVIVLGIYRLVSGTVYRTSPEELIAEGLAIFIIIFIFKAAEKKSPIGLAVVSLMVINGADLSFMMWIAIVFMCLWMVVEKEASKAMMVASACGMAAAMMGESQWGLLMTLMLAIPATYPVRKYNAVIQVAVFTAVCWLAGYVDGGVILGVDKYCLAIAVAVFAVVYWKFNDKAKRLELNIAATQSAATGLINGDNCTWKGISNGRVAMVVSDGMGKGKKAATQSLIAMETMISLLKQGATAEMAIKMINTMMLLKDEESYTTLDMVIFDRHTGKAKFYKAGAAPTLIRRKDKVEEIMISSVPLGIVEDIEVKCVETTLKKSDWIIMMSDGVSEGYKIKETVTRIKSSDPQTMSDIIIKRATYSYLGRERDDMTVIVAHVI